LSLKSLFQWLFVPIFTELLAKDVLILFEKYRAKTTTARIFAVTINHISAMFLFDSDSGARYDIAPSRGLVSWSMVAINFKVTGSDAAAGDTPACTAARETS
jgi:hypothetical protein